jgi:hypothetical protein
MANRESLLLRVGAARCRPSCCPLCCPSRDGRASVPAESLSHRYRRKRFRHSSSLRERLCPCATVYATVYVVALSWPFDFTRGRPGRPASRGDKVKQLLTMARENPSWGIHAPSRCTREPGHRSRTVDHPAHPHRARHRARSAPGKEDALEDLSQGSLRCHRRRGLLQRGGAHARGLVRYFVLFVIDLKTRRVHIAGVTCAADGAWMAQVARNLTDVAAGPLTGFGHLIVDRDPLYTAHFQTLLQAAGVQLLRLPSRSPNLNAYAERFVRRSGTSASGTLSLWASVTCVPSCASSSSTTTPSATTRAWATSSPSPSRDSASPIGRIGVIHAVEPQSRAHFESHGLPYSCVHPGDTRSRWV